jgi:hypothetical protein
MICLQCNHKNPGTVAYCQRCGAKMDFTADEIQQALVDKARGEVVQNTEFYARQALVFSAVLLLLAITLLVLSGGAPQESYYIPSIVYGGSPNAPGAKYLETDFKLDPTLPKLVIPLEFRKR